MCSSLGRQPVLFNDQLNTTDPARPEALMTDTSDVDDTIEVSVKYHLGSLVDVLPVFPDFECRQGVLRFFGKTDFADGLWAGVELSNSTGENDGSVKGRKYFTCTTSSGIFVRPNLIVLHPETRREERTESRKISQPKGIKERDNTEFSPSVKCLNYSCGGDRMELECWKESTEPVESIVKGRRIENEKAVDRIQVSGAISARISSDMPTKSASSLFDRTKQLPQDEHYMKMKQDMASVLEPASEAGKDVALLLFRLDTEANKNYQSTGQTQPPNLDSYTRAGDKDENLDRKATQILSNEHSSALRVPTNNTQEVASEESEKELPSLQENRRNESTSLVSELPEPLMMSLITKKPAGTDYEKSSSIGKDLVLLNEDIHKDMENLKTKILSVQTNLCPNCYESTKLQQACDEISVIVVRLAADLENIRAMITNSIHKLLRDSPDTYSELILERDQLKEISKLQESELLKEKEQSDELSKVLSTVSNAHRRAIQEWSNVKIALETQVQQLKEKLDDREIWRHQEGITCRVAAIDISHDNTFSQSQEHQELTHQVHELSKQLDASRLQLLQLRKEKESIEVLRGRSDALGCECEKAWETEKQQVKGMIQNYEAALHQLRIIKDKAQAECAMLREQLASHSAKFQDDQVSSITDTSVPNALLTTWERHKYEAVVREQKRAVWYLQGKHVFSTFFPKMACFAGMHSGVLSTPQSIGESDKTRNLTSLIFEAHEELTYVKWVSFFSSSLLQNSTFNSLNYEAVPLNSILDFSTEGSYSYSTGSMFKCFT